MNFRLRSALVLSLLSSACAGSFGDEPRGLAQPLGGVPDAGTHVPPGYRPPALIPPGYDPPMLLTLTPAQQLDIYKRIEAHFVGQTAKRGATVSALPVADRQIAPRVTWRAQTYDDVGAFMEAARFSGVLVLKDGAIVLERYALGRTAEDRWTSFSVGKSVTSLLVGAALQDGAIKDLDEPVTKYIPALAGSAYEGVNIRQLLTMTSGVKWNEDYTDPESDIAKSASWSGQPGESTMVSYMRRLPRDAPPGTVFNYNTGETDMAGVLVANATGRGIAQYLSEKIWAPFGMDQDAFWIVDGGSFERGGCCISMSLRDYGRLGQFVLGGGVAGGKQVVPPWFLEASTRSQIPPAQGDYGYFWWIDGPGSFSARGIHGQSIVLVPSLGLVVVTNGAYPKATSGELRAAIGALVDATIASLR